MVNFLRKILGVEKVNIIQKLAGMHDRVNIVGLLSMLVTGRKIGRYSSQGRNQVQRDASITPNAYLYYTYTFVHQF